MSAWIVTPNHITQVVAGAIRLGLLSESDAQAVGVMLTRANVLSVKVRYGDRIEDVEPYRWPGLPGPFDVFADDVSLYKQVRCYAYQTCEYEGYEESPAGRFASALMLALEERGASASDPRYDAAPWGV